MIKSQLLKDMNKDNDKPKLTKLQDIDNGDQDMSFNDVFIRSPSNPLMNKNDKAMIENKLQDELTKQQRPISALKKISLKQNPYLNKMHS